MTLRKRGWGKGGQPNSQLGNGPAAHLALAAVYLGPSSISVVFVLVAHRYLNVVGSVEMGCKVDFSMLPGPHRVYPSPVILSEFTFWSSGPKET